VVHPFRPRNFPTDFDVWWHWFLLWSWQRWEISINLWNVMPNSTFSKRFRIKITRISFWVVKSWDILFLLKDSDCVKLQLELFVSGFCPSYGFIRRKQHLVIWTVTVLYRCGACPWGSVGPVAISDGPHQPCTLSPEDGNTPFPEMLPFSEQQTMNKAPMSVSFNQHYLDYSEFFYCYFLESFRRGSHILCN